MIICHRHRFIFVKTRKTGGTSVEIALAEHTGPDDVLTRFGSKEDNEMRRQRGADAQNQAVPLGKLRPGEWGTLLTRLRRPSFRSHMPAAEIRRLVPPGVWDGYLTFTIARNPWETAASGYAWQMRRGGAGPSFSEFLRTRIDMWHNWPMYTVDDEIVVDEIMRHEELEQSLGVITDRLGLPRLDLPRAKGGVRRGPYQEMFDHADRDLVAEVCRREIEYFGWTFD